MIRNGFYNGAGAVIGLVASVATIPLLVHLLGLDEFGLWTLASAVVGVAGLAEAGLSVSTTVFLSRDLANRDSTGVSQTLMITVGAMLLVATSVALLLWTCAEPLVALFPSLSASQRVAAVQALQVGGLVVWGRLLQQVFIGVQQACQRYMQINVVSTIQTLLVNLGLLLIAWLGGRTLALMQMQAVLTAGALLVLVWQARRTLMQLELRPSWDFKKARLVASYSGATWLVSMSGALFTQVDRIIVGAILGTGPLGVYGVITSITTKINSLSAAPVQPLLPELTASMARQDQDTTAKAGRIQVTLQQALRLNAFVALGSGAVLFMLAPFVLTVMVPDAATSENILAFQIAVVIYALYSLNATGFYVLLSQAVRLCMTIQLVSAAVSLLMIGIGASKFGLLGAVCGNAGYLGVWLLTITGMKHLGVSTRNWSTWLSFPVIWFLLLVLVTLVLPDDLFLRIVCLTAMLAPFLFWFHRHTMKHHLVFLPRR